MLYHQGAMFTFTKLFWDVIAPSNLFVLVLCFSVVLLWTRWRGLGRGLLVVLALFAVLVSVLPLGAWLALPLENRFPQPVRLPERVDGIVVLGGAVQPSVSHARGQPALNGRAERMIAAAALARAYPQARLVFTGGSASPFHQEQEDKEAPVARVVFEQLGLGPDIDSGRVQFEAESRNTFENVIYARRLAKPQPGEVWILVTSAMHMPRAMGCFRRAGWPVMAYPVDYRTAASEGLALGFNFGGGLRGLVEGVREWVGLFVYRLLGRTTELFPDPPAGA